MEKEEYQFVYSGTSVRPSDHPTPSKGIFQLVPWRITSEHPIANIAGQTGYQARTLSNQDGSGSCSNHIHALCFRCEDTFIVTLPTSLLVQVSHKRLFWTSWGTRGFPCVRYLLGPLASRTFFYCSNFPHKSRMRSFRTRYLAYHYLECGDSVSVGSRDGFETSHCV